MSSSQQQQSSNTYNNNTTNSANTAGFTNNQGSNTSSSSGPSAFQLPYLQQAFSGATNSLGQAASNANGGVYGAPTQFTASFTPAMMDAFAKEMGYGTNTSVADTSAGIQSGIAPSAVAALNSGLYGLSNYSTPDATQQNIANAGAYADNPYLSGQVSAAMRDANQQYTDVTAPAIARNAAGTGNINSTAPSIQQGIVQRGLAQQAGDISANLRSQAYTQGLNLSQQAELAKNQNTLGALLGLTQGGNSAVGSAVGAGTGSVGQGTGLFNIANAGAQNTLAGLQAPLTNQQQAFNFGQTSPFTALQQYMGIVGGNQWGQQASGTSSSSNAGTSTANGTSNTVGFGNSNSTTTSTPSTLAQIGAITGMLGSLF